MLKNTVNIINLLLISLCLSYATDPDLATLVDLVKKQQSNSLQTQQYKDIESFIAKVKTKWVIRKDLAKLKERNSQITVLNEHKVAVNQGINYCETHFNLWHQILTNIQSLTKYQVFYLQIYQFLYPSSTTSQVKNDGELTNSINKALMILNKEMKELFASFYRTLKHEYSHDQIIYQPLGAGYIWAAVGSFENKLNRAWNGENWLDNGPHYLEQKERFEKFFRSIENQCKQHKFPFYYYFPLHDSLNYQTIGFQQLSDIIIKADAYEKSPIR